MNQEIQQELAAQVAAAFRVVEQRMKPARLSNTYTNALQIVAFLRDNGLPPNPENVYHAINALADALRWDVEPAKLAARRVNERPARLNSATEAVKPFLDKLRAGEAAEQTARADQQSIRDAKRIIDSYAPTKETPRGSSIDYSEQQKAQEAWTKSLEQVIAGKGDLQRFVAVLKTEVEKRYANVEKRRERV